jgi:hypothetical protein
MYNSDTRIKTIRLEYISDVYKFVELASKAEDRVEVTTGTFTVDGASLMGMFSIDPSKKFTVEYPSSAKEFDKFISQFTV